MLGRANKVVVINEYVQIEFTRFGLCLKYDCLCKFRFVSVNLICGQKVSSRIRCSFLFETKSIVARNLRLTGVPLINSQLNLEHCIGAVKINNSFEIQFVNYRGDTESATPKVLFMQIFQCKQM